MQTGNVTKLVPEQESRGAHGSTMTERFPVAFHTMVTIDWKQARDIVSVTIRVVLPRDTI